jgi:choline dehydrogenase
MECLEPGSLLPSLNLVSKGLIGLEWLLFKSGLGATNHFESCGFIRSSAGVDYPDIEYHFLPIAIRYDGKAAAKGHSFQVHVGPMRSKSRGFVRARSGDPTEVPMIKFNYMSHPDDWTEFRSCVRLTREIFEQEALRPYKGREIQPGEQLESDAEIDGFIRDHCESAFHPCGTCKMGSASDPLAVVDPECRVIGIEALRVADSSIMPRITNGEKASDHILGRDPLPPSNQEPWINPHWKTSQK